MDARYAQKKLGGLLQGDKVIWLVIGLLAILSVLTVYSSAEALALRTGADTESFLIKHIVLLGAAVALHLPHGQLCQIRALVGDFIGGGHSFAVVYPIAGRNLQSSNALDSDSLYWGDLPDVGFCQNCLDHVHGAYLVADAAQSGTVG